MFIFIQPSQFNIQNIYFLEKKKNMIMDGHFTKFVFSNECMIMNGLFFKLPQVLNSTYVLTIDTSQHKEWINRIHVIERQILQYYQMYYNIQKNSVYILRNQLQKGIIKYYRDNEKNYLQASTGYYLKISGIWETQTDIGITFKVIEYGTI